MVILEPACRLTRFLVFALGPGKINGEFLEKAAVTRKAKDVVNPVRLAPGHEILPREAAIGPEQDAYPRPAAAMPRSLAEPISRVHRALCRRFRSERHVHV